MCLFPLENYQPDQEEYNYLKKKIVNENPKPQEYKTARKFMYYDFDGDGDEDLYAFFTLEGFGGGNNWQHYIAIFEIENNLVKAVDDMVLYGDSLKEYNNGEFLKFSNGYVYFRLYGYDWEKQEKFIKTIKFKCLIRSNLHKKCFEQAQIHIHKI